MPDSAHADDCQVHNCNPPWACTCGHTRIPSEEEIAVPARMWERFKDVARAHHRSRPDHLRYLMDKAIVQHYDTESLFQRIEDDE